VASQTNATDNFYYVTYNQRMEPKQTQMHDGIDAFIATIIGWCEERFSPAPEENADVAFSDEWERKQIARELNWN
jgi:hypothetical protein